MNQMDWDALRLLLAVEAAGSLRGAAPAVGLSQPTLGRRLEALERSLGLPLLVRHARGVELTDGGRAVVESARLVGEQLDELQRALTGQVAEVAGRVRISCTEPVAAALLPDSLARLRRDHPRLAIDVVADMHASDLDRREADIAVRMFPPAQASLIARRLGTTHSAFYASRAYIEAHGAPQRLEDLADHAVIGPDRDALFVRQAERLGFSVDQMTYRTDAPGAVRAWVERGVAIGVLLCAAADPDPRLVRVLPPVAEHPVWLVTHPDLRGSVTVAAVWDRLAADLPPRL